MKLNIIKWLDHVSYDKGDFRDEIDVEPAVVTSVGWAVKETEESVILAANVCPGDEIEMERISNCQLILKSCITLRKEIDDQGQFVLL
jgi:hypothetical protein